MKLRLRCPCERNLADIHHSDHDPMWTGDGLRSLTVHETECSLLGFPKAMKHSESAQMAGEPIRTIKLAYREQSGY